MSRLVICENDYPKFILPKGTTNEEAEEYRKRLQAEARHTHVYVHVKEVYELERIPES